MNTNAINWVEIPVTDMDRAAKFYETILGWSVRRELFMGIPHGMFPADVAGVGGALVKADGYTPTTEGTVVYLNAGTQLESVVGRVQAAGGEILLPVTPIPPAGTMAIIRDTEGNRVGLHQPPQN